MFIKLSYVTSKIYPIRTDYILIYITKQKVWQNHVHILWDILCISTHHTSIILSWPCFIKSSYIYHHIFALFHQIIIYLSSWLSHVSSNYHTSIMSCFPWQVYARVHSLADSKLAGNSSSGLVSPANMQFPHWAQTSRSGQAAWLQPGTLHGATGDQG